MIKHKNILQSLTFTLVVFVVNFFIPSQINGFPRNGFNLDIANLYFSTNAEEIFNIRYNDPVFRSRPFILEIQKYLFDNFSFPFQFSFNLINFIFLFVLFLILPKLNLFNNNQKPINLRIIFLLSLPIIFAFFGSMGTYDDFPQYVFILLFLIFLFRENHFASVVFFILACIVRETSLLFYIVILSFLFLNSTSQKTIKLFIWLSPIIIYATFLNLYLDEEVIKSSKTFLTTKRFYAWQTNFLTLNKFRESTSILFVMVFPYLCLLYSKYKKKESNIVTKRWCKISAFFILTNTLIVSISGIISELRLLFIPLLFVLPFIQKEISCSFARLFKKFRLNHMILAILSSCIISLIWYSPRAVGTGYFFKLYIFLCLTIVFYIALEKQIKTSS